MTELIRILYVEDEPDIREIAVMALELVGGFTLCVCESGTQAVEKARAFQPQLALLDIMMPGMDGPTTMNRLHTIEELADLPVIFMTAKVQPQEIAEYLEIGALDVIAKPFDPMTLPDRVNAVWNRAIHGS
ncbi:MAG: response regulator [Acidimicrobiia bacterium]|nr:response regulator [Acidimicrobiia bacterium]MDX2465799.1 response regulator [Acidimicrobiia bacterium]